jgi:hypothetical protein
VIEREPFHRVVAYVTDTLERRPLPGGIQVERFADVSNDRPSSRQMLTDRRELLKFWLCRMRSRPLRTSNLPVILLEAD